MLSKVSRNERSLSCLHHSPVVLYLQPWAVTRIRGHTAQEVSSPIEVSTGQGHYGVKYVSDDVIIVSLSGPLYCAYHMLQV